MKIIKMEVGALGTNCYILYCEQTREGLVIDPGGNGEEILALIRRENIKVLFVVNTHGHADHIAANDIISNDTGAVVCVHEEDAPMLISSQSNLSAFIGMPMECQPAQRLLKEGDIIHFGNIEMKVLHTPGHTPGGICLLIDDILIAGDTLFAQSIGRTDFPGGSYSQLIENIKNKLMVLPEHVKVLPGHGPDTTIGDERNMNPFIQ